MHQIIAQLQKYVASEVQRDLWPEYVPPLSLGVIEAVEQQLQFQFPGLLRELYLYVGTGGFGPDVERHDGLILSLKEEAAPLYRSLQQQFRNNPLWHWSDHIFPFCDWGCGMYSCIDCAHPDTPLLLYDTNVQFFNRPSPVVLVAQGQSFVEWLTAWLNGEPLGEQIVKLERPVPTSQDVHLMEQNDDDY